MWSKVINSQEIISVQRAVRVLPSFLSRSKTERLMKALKILLLRKCDYHSQSLGRSLQITDVQFQFFETPILELFFGRFFQLVACISNISCNARRDAFFYDIKGSNLISSLAPSGDLSVLVPSLSICIWAMSASLYWHCWNTPHNDKNNQGWHEVIENQSPKIQNKNMDVWGHVYAETL